MTLRQLLIVLTLAAVAVIPRSYSFAQDDPQGTARIEISAGYETAYGNYCLPVANSGLGRAAADSGNLEWQLAANYSVVPVFVRISHRQSIAMTGRVEVFSSQPYYAEESPAMHTMTVVRKFVAPPGVPITVALAPRVAPKATPGRPVTLDVRIFREGMQKPFATYQVQATQLEPAHVYSLLITGDAQLAPPMVSTIDVSKYTKLPKFMVEDKAPPYEGLLSLNHYVLPVDRASFTALPLATRDFAFVCLNAQAARNWSSGEQDALIQYALAGGYLCLYNTAGISSIGSLRVAGSQQLGRGFVLDCPGGLDAARKQMDSWLRGDLEECALWMYGSVQGDRIYPEQLEGRYTSRDLSQLFLDARQLYSGPDPTHAAGYLNPIWLYRETCRAGAVEPWDYPEFNVAYRISRPSTLRPDRNPLLQNWNFAWVAQQFSELLVKPLRDLVQPTRAPGGERTVAMCTVVFMLGCCVATLLRPRGSAPSALIALAASLLLVGSWLTVKPAGLNETRLVLVDADVQSPACTQRELTALPAGSAGASIVDTLGIIRFVRCEKLGDLSITPAEAGPAAAGPDARTSVFADGPFLTIASDGACDSALKSDWPVRMWRDTGGDEIAVHVDTSKLTQGSFAVLFTPDGAEQVPAGLADYLMRIAPLGIGLTPGASRLLEWQEHYRRSGQLSGRFRQGRGIGPWVGAPEPFNMLRLATAETASFPVRDDLSRLAWSGLLQTVGGARSFMGNQCWLYCELPSDDAHERKFLRLTMSLDGGDE